MKKCMLRSLLLTGIMCVGLVLVGGTAMPTYANHYPETDPQWTVTFTSANKMVSNFSTGDIDQTVSQMQPGDDATFRVTVTNANAQDTNWYMENKVLKSLEDRSALDATSGGGYTYELLYVDSSGNQEELFNSDRVGGEQGYVDRQNQLREGLNEATENLEDWFFLEKLSTGKSGHIQLNVTLDGETQGNDYQDTLADIQMEFAVELVQTTSTTGRTSTNTTTGRVGTIVKTGDDTNNLLYIVLAAVAGVILLILALVSMKRRKEQKDEEPELTDDEEKGDRL